MSRPPGILVESHLIAEEVHRALQLVQLRYVISLSRARNPLRAGSRIDPVVGRQERALALGHIPDVVVMRNDDARVELLDDGLGMHVAHDVLRAIDGKQRDIDVPEGLPDARRRIVTVVSPVNDTHPARLYHDQAMIPGAGIARGLDVGAVQELMDLLKSYIAQLESMACLSASP